MINLKLLVIDVDGTMTDSGIYYDEKGNEIKKFCTKDAAGFFAAKKAGIKILVLTGRKSLATEKRMNELKVDYLFQGVKNKASFLSDFIKKNEYNKQDIGYIGDDLNDLQAMRLTNFVCCPLDSCQEIIDNADYVSKMRGGYGVVRDVIEFILRNNSQWKKIINDIYDAGI